MEYVTVKIISRALWSDLPGAGFGMKAFQYYRVIGEPDVNERPLEQACTPDEKSLDSISLFSKMLLSFHHNLLWHNHSLSPKTKNKNKNHFDF